MPSPAADPTKLVGFPVYNGFWPKEKPKALAVNLDFTQAAVIPIDLTIAEQEGRFRFVQAVYIDNSANPSPLSLTVSMTQQTVTMPAASQGYLPLLCPNPAKLIASLATVGVGNTSTIIQFLNFPVPAAVWSTNNLQASPTTETSIAAVALGSAAGLIVNLNNKGFLNLSSLSGKYSASLTAGNRLPALQINNAALLPIFNALVAPAATVIAASRLFFSGAAGQPLVANASPVGLLGTFPFPSIKLPPNSELQFSDLNVIDNADTISLEFVSQAVF